MGKFLLGILVGIVLAGLGLLIIVLVIARLFTPKTPSIESNSALVLALEGPVPEAVPVEIPLPFLRQTSKPTVRDFWTALHAAAGDSRIKALVLEPHGLEAGHAKLQEIHEEILDFKKSGKPVYAFLQSPGLAEYYVASAADKIYLSPDDLLDVRGMQASVMFFKSALDKLGVDFQVDHIGAYKDAGDVFTRTNMTPETREVLNAVLDQIYSDFCSTAGAGRHKTADQMRDLVDSGPFTSTQAKSAGLIDVVGYEDQLFGDLKQKTAVADVKKLPMPQYVQATPGSGDHIAVLVAEGEIMPAAAGDSSDSQVAYREMLRLTREVRSDNSVKGVILRVDSPGGDAVASDEILHELKLLAAKKPVVISFSDLAASGGYYISMTGDPIVAYPNTITGSIGVLYARPNVQKLLGKLGIDQDSVSRGRMANIDSLTEPLSDAEVTKLHEQLTETYDTFVGKVASARHRSFDQIEPLAQGRVWMGSQARQNGLVDELGGLDRAVALIRQRAHLPASGSTNLILYPPKKSLWEWLAGSSSESATEAIVRSKLRSVAPGLPGDAILHGGVLRLMPFTITVH